MLTGTKPTFHPLTSLRAHPSLLPLQKALSAAESTVPCRPPQTDANEQLAMQLIARMQAHYKKEFPFLSVQDIPDMHGLQIHIHGMVEAHAG
jgi:hypothetical protein